MKETMGTTDIQKALKDLIDCKILDMDKKTRFKFSPQYKEAVYKVAKDQKMKTKEEALLNILWQFGYFDKSRTEQEIMNVCRLLMLKR